MSLPIHVNVIWDPTNGANLHTLWGPAPVIPPAPGTPTASFEMITTQMWSAGFLLGQNKFTTTILHRGVFICIDDHDIGTLIPDITIPPVNAYYAIMWPFSSRKMVFTASTVKMNKKPTSCSQIFPPLPMMTCGDPVTLPLGRPLINFMNTVTVGLTWADFGMGVLKIALSMAIDVIFDWKAIKNFFKGVKEVGEEAAEKLGNLIAKETIKKLGFDGSPKALAKKAISALAGWGTSALEGNPTLSLKVGGGLVPEVGVQAGGDPDAGSGEVFGIPVAATSGNLPSAEQINILR